MTATATPTTQQLEHFSMVIDGQAVGAASGATYQTENPTDVTSESAVVCEEVFGPVLAALRFTMRTRRFAWPTPPLRIGRAALRTGPVHHLLP